ncbi:receptor-like protein eix2 [Quercus suber]|uniref:Receptor-like protein eix2 n=1 Tax=Quercus suber TaxID=58331 RepID=A0AAW0JGE9_QUESU
MYIRKGSKSSFSISMSRTFPKAFASKVNNWLCVVNKLPYLTSLYSCNLLNIFFVPLVNSSTSFDVLNLSYNNLTSPSSILEWLFNSNTSVVELYLANNQFQGLIPNAFSRINSLAIVYLGSNEFEGEIPKAFGGMCNLKTLYLSGNYLNGQLDYIQNLTGSDWVPPFQLNEIDLQFCRLGPQFPKWLQTQKNYYSLDISNSRILESLN